MPAPRPAELRQLQAINPSRREVAQANAVAALEPKKPSIFEKLFGRPAPAGLQLAFASPDGGVTSDGESLTLGRAPQYDQSTAVYVFPRIWSTCRTAPNSRRIRGSGLETNQYHQASDQLDDDRDPNRYVRKRYVVAFGESLRRPARIHQLVIAGPNEKTDINRRPSEAR